MKEMRCEGGELETERGRLETGKWEWKSQMKTGTIINILLSKIKCFSAI